MEKKENQPTDLHTLDRFLLNVHCSTAQGSMNDKTNLQQRHMGGSSSNVQNAPATSGDTLGKSPRKKPTKVWCTISTRWLPHYGADSCNYTPPTGKNVYINSLVATHPRQPPIFVTATLQNDLPRATWGAA